LREKLGGLDGVSNISPLSTEEGDEAISIENVRPYSKWYRNCFRQRKSSGEPKYDSPLTKTLHHTFFFHIWTAGILKLLSDTLKTMTPLLSKVILTWLANSYTYFRLSDAQRAASDIKQPQGMTYGIGLAIGLFTMQEVASLVNLCLDSL